LKDLILSEFETLGLSPRITKSLASLGLDIPTPIQTQAIPEILRGRDLMGLAQTGTGKTAAFGLPLAQILAADRVRPEPKSVRALILAPTRELVNQIATNLKAYVRGGPLSVATVVGGVGIGPQVQNLARGVDILVATPGRLIDLLDRRAVTLRDAKFLVLDEADQMLDMGFIHALRQIAPLLARPRQTLLFSATMPKLMAELASAYLTDPVRIEVAPPGRAADKVSQSVHWVKGQAHKTALLIELLLKDRNDLSLVFARTKHGAEKLMKSLTDAGIDAASIHGNKSQGQRDRAIAQFRAGRIRVLVATDVAARGIDIPGVSHVYNYDLPEVAEQYVHRIGRTARAGAEGRAVAFAAADDLPLLRAIERLMKLPVEVASGEAPPAAEAGAPRPARGGQGGRGRPPGQGRPQGQGRPKSGGKPQGAGARTDDGKPRGKPTGSRRPYGGTDAMSRDMGDSPRRGAEGAPAAKHPAAQGAGAEPAAHSQGTGRGPAPAANGNGGNSGAAPGFRPKGWRVRQRATA
jgi:ATP-dependent RNA helicase RhlE